MWIGRRLLVMGMLFQRKRRMFFQIERRMLFQRERRMLFQGETGVVPGIEKGGTVEGAAGVDENSLGGEVEDFLVVLNGKGRTHKEIRRLKEEEERKQKRK